MGPARQAEKRRDLLWFTSLTEDNTEHEHKPSTYLVSSFCEHSSASRGGFNFCALADEGMKPKSSARLTH